MYVNKFGSRNVIKTVPNNNSKFISLTNNLQTKLDKAGDGMTGDLHMGNNKVTSTFSPNSDDVLTNRAYVNNTISDVLKSKLNKGGKMDGSIDMQDNQIVNLGHPINDKDAVNKEYVDNKYISEADDIIDIESLIKIANTLKILELDPRRYLYFNTKSDQVENLHGVIEKQYKRNNTERVFKKFENLLIVRELKVAIMRIILDLSEEDFIKLKKSLLENKLLNILEEKTIFWKIQRIVNELARGLNPERKNKEIELLTQKNLTLIQLGYFFIHEELLKDAK